MTRCIHFFTAVVILTCLTGCQTPTSSPDDLTIQLDGGLISGTPVGSDGQIRAYKGIPYAAPPVGDLRWRPPQPAKGWDGVRETHQFSPVCPQPIPEGLYQPSNLELTTVATQFEEQSEDCLYLNVWTGAASSDERRPVMLWIHGGGLITGSGSRPIEDGATLARKGAVLVTINYRLGPLGYLAHPELTAESEPTPRAITAYLIKLQLFCGFSETSLPLAAIPTGSRFSVCRPAPGASVIWSPPLWPRGCFTRPSGRAEEELFFPWPT